MATDTTTEAFDYIIVGGGTAGLVVACRLSEDSDVRVLVVEAGSDRSADPLVIVPGLVPAQYGRPEYDWNFLSVPQPSLNGRQINQACGRMLGGSSGLNFNMVLWPSRTILDAWGKLGNVGWDYDTLAPYFRKYATVNPPAQAVRDVLTGFDDYHDSTLVGDGPWQVTYGEGFTSVFNGAWFETFAKLGLKNKSDPRNGNALGAFQNGASIDPKTKTRSYAGNAWYNEEVRKRPNLVVWTDSLVEKILFEKAGAKGEGEKESDADVVATGVSVRTKDGEKKTVTAKREVVLAAGALQSPQILELSGIGGRALLDKHGIPVVVDNPHVGEHMQDHPIVCQSFEVKDGVPSADVLRDSNVVQQLLQIYQTTGEGPLGQSIISVAYTPLADGSGVMASEEKAKFLDAHLKGYKPASEFDASETEVALLRAGLEDPKEAAIQYLLFPSQIITHQAPEHMGSVITPVLPENFITVMTILNHPFSRGRCHITSADVADKPEWDPRYNAVDIDLEILARNVQFVEKIVATPPFSDIFKPGGRRLPEIKATGDDSDAALERAREIVRQRQISVYHVSGSCGMRPRADGGVVDARLRVYGTRNVRVVDAAVFPVEPLGNIQSTVYAVAERAAAIIKEERAGSLGVERLKV